MLLQLFYTACFFLLIAFLGIIFWSRPKRHCLALKDKHVFITGGSKGIGRAIAAECLRRGARYVSIAARNATSLADAKTHLNSVAKMSQTVLTYELDVTAEYEQINAVIQKAEAEAAPIDVLINNAGFVVQGGFDEIPIESFMNQMKINYVGSALVSRAVVGGMKERRRGHICFVSSIAGQCAIWGYSSYSPSKFALRGLADALHMELLPHRVGVSIIYPPNTNTEGYAIEQRDMPRQTREISGAAGLFTPETIARSTLNTIENGGYQTTIGVEGWMMGVLTAGASPEPSALSAWTQFAFTGLFRGIMLFYLGAFNRIVREINDKTHDPIRTSDDDEQPTQT